ncbi:MAG: DUF456 domain-containing protein [Bacillota bacterium]
MGINYLALSISMIIILAGIAGSFLPMLPGLPLVFTGMLVYGVIAGFNTVTGTFLLLMFMLALLGMSVEYWASAIGAKKFGASRLGVVGAVLGGIIGVITLGPVGVLVGPLVGTIVGEMIQGKDVQTAIRASLGALIGQLGGTFVQFVIGVVMTIMFLARVF